MLASIVVSLVSERNAVLPAHLGRANMAETLNRLAGFDAALTADLHDLDGPKPFTCSDLHGNVQRREGRCLIRAGEIYWVRMTGLTEPVSHTLVEALWGQRPEAWRLSDHPFRVVCVYCNPAHHPWSGTTESKDLIERHLLGGASIHALQRVSLELLSPLAFKSNEMHMPLPLPGLVFGSLIDRWNAFSSLPLLAELRRFAEGGVAINRFDLHSVPMPHKQGALRIGAVGQVSYTAQWDDRYWLAAFQAMADFALYSGVGVQTAAGMGQARRIPA